MFKSIALFIITVCLISCKHKSHNNFFNNLSQYCDQSLVGKTVFSTNPGDVFANKKLIMHVAECTDKFIRIPFKVGDDSSRTWIISKTNKGLLLKHDHRHADGTPDEVTLYGGYANIHSSSLVAHFEADDATAKMLPEAKTNVWTLSIDSDSKEFVYYLERHNKARYKAVFDIL